MSKYIICKGCYGFGGNIAVLACAIRLARKLNRKLIVDWVDNIGYCIENQDIFKILFKQTGFEFKENIDFSSMTVWPEYWKDYIEQTMPVSKDHVFTRVSSDIIEEEKDVQDFDVVVVSRDDKYWHRHEYYEEMSAITNQVKPTDYLNDKINIFHKQKMGNNAIGVHVRHGNGEKVVVPPDIDWFFASVNEFLNKSPSSKIFLSTDCSAVETIFQNEYGDKVVFTHKYHLPLGSGPMFNTEYGDVEKLRSAEEALLDLWLLSKCSYIVASKSFFSGVAIKLNGNFDRSNEKTWVPKHRLYKKPENVSHISDFKELNNLFVKEKLTTDGVYYEKIEDNIKLYYLYELITDIMSIDEFDLETVKNSLLKYRLY